MAFSFIVFPLVVVFPFVVVVVFLFWLDAVIVITKILADKTFIFSSLTNNYTVRNMLPS